MKKKIFGRKLQRDTNERKALFKSLMSELILKEQIKTTAAKAKSVRANIEKLVTKLKNASLEKSKMFQGVLSYEVFSKLKNEIAPRFLNRNGGYTRIIKISSRIRDNAKMVILEWVEKRDTKGKLESKGAQDGGKNVILEKPKGMSAGAKIGAGQESKAKIKVKSITKEIKKK